MNKKNLEDIASRLERMESLAEDIDVMAYHLRLDIEKELKRPHKTGVKK